MATIQDRKFLEKKLVQFIREDDPLLSMLQWLMDKLMLIEAEGKVGAKKNSHSDERNTHFSGKRVRRFDSRLGTMYLLVPKLRNGGYVPFFVTEKKRSEQALLDVIHESYINGVSTRKIDRLAKSLGIENISASQVSEINKALDEQVTEFRNRPLDAEYPFLWIDALYQKIRQSGRVVNVAVMTVFGVNMAGKREILAIEPMHNESEDTYNQFFKRLKKRGLKNTWMVISDSHEGLKKAVEKNFLAASWQRCKVHFMRNINALVSHSDKKEFANRLKQIWYQPDKETAIRYAKSFIKEYRKKYPKAINTLRSGLEDSLQFYFFNDFDFRKLSSTNPLDRLHKEIRRRSKVVGVFPDSDSYLRLIGSYLIEYQEDWETDRNYIQENKILEFKESITTIVS